MIDEELSASGQYYASDRSAIGPGEKSDRDLSWRLSDLWACFGRPHTIFGRVRIVEAKPHIHKGTPALAWVFRNKHPIGPQGRHRCRVGNFLEARPAVGEVPETL